MIGLFCRSKVYNQKDHEGFKPVFRATSSEKVEIFLRAGLTDLHTSLGDDGYTLLHHCLSRFQVSRQLVYYLRGQWLKSYRGNTPLLSVFEKNADGPGKLIFRSKGGGKAVVKLRERKTDAESSHGSRSIPKRTNGPFFNGTSEQMVELFIQHADLSSSEAQHMYKICLQYKLFTLKLSTVLCPIIAKENYGKQMVLLPLLDMWLSHVLLL